MYTYSLSVLCAAMVHAATMYVWNSQVIPQQQHMYTYSLSVLCAAMVHAATMYVWNSQVIPQQHHMYTYSLSVLCAAMVQLPCTYGIVKLYLSNNICTLIH